MKKINMNYTTNNQLWSIEDLAANHGYTKTNDCYWAQIFENENGDQIITSREDTASADPAADLAALLDEAEAPAETAEQYTEIRTMDAFTLRGICIKNHWYTRGTCDQYGKDNTMKYMIVYCKTTPAITYRNTLEAAQALAQQLKRCGYTAEIWEQGAEGSRPIR